MTYIDQVLNYGFEAEKPSLYLIASNIVATIGIASAYLAGTKVILLASIFYSVLLITLILRNHAGNYLKISFANLLISIVLCLILFF